MIWRRRRRKTLVVAGVVTDELLRDAADGRVVLDLMKEERESRGFIPGKDIWLGYIVPRDADLMQGLWDR